MAPTSPRRPQPGHTHVPRTWSSDHVTLVLGPRHSCPRPCHVGPPSVHTSALVAHVDPRPRARRLVHVSPRPLARCWPSSSCTHVGPRPRHPKLRWGWRGQPARERCGRCSSLSVAVTLSSSLLRPPTPLYMGQKPITAKFTFRTDPNVTPCETPTMPPHLKKLLPVSYWHLLK